MPTSRFGAERTVSYWVAEPNDLTQSKEPEFPAVWQTKKIPSRSPSGGGSRSYTSTDLLSALSPSLYIGYCILQSLKPRDSKLKEPKMCPNIKYQVSKISRHKCLPINQPIKGRRPRLLEALFLSKAGDITIMPTLRWAWVSINIILFPPRNK